jgi:hypothetical protein
MILRFALLNLSFLSLAQWLFIRLTSASPNVQLFLHGAFGIAASSYLLGVYWVYRMTHRVAASESLARKFR